MNETLVVDNELIQIRKLKYLMSWQFSLGPVLCGMTAAPSRS